MPELVGWPQAPFFLVMGCLKKMMNTFCSRAYDFRKQKNGKYNKYFEIFTMIINL